MVNPTEFLLVPSLAARPDIAFTAPAPAPSTEVGVPIGRDHGASSVAGVDRSSLEAAGFGPRLFLDLIARFERPT